MSDGRKTWSGDPEVRLLHALLVALEEAPRWAFRAWFVYVAWRLVPGYGSETAISVVLAAWALSTRSGPR